MPIKAKQVQYHLVGIPTNFFAIYFLAINHSTIFDTGRNLKKVFMLPLLIDKAIRIQKSRYSMKSTIVLFVLLCGCSLSSRSQITKGNWLLGGNIDFSQSSNTSPSTALQKATSLNVSPLVGYFIIDKFALGARSSVSYSYVTAGSSKNASTQIDIGPFARYYCLSTENRVNILVEGSYIFQLSRIPNTSFGSTNGYKLMAGPVIYLNNIVGIEFIVGYSSQNTLAKDGRLNVFRTGIGIQVHLEKQND
jgi:hypothetical protein